MWEFDFNNDFFEKIKFRRDFQGKKFDFTQKRISLPKEKVYFINEIPQFFENYDNKFLIFSKEHPGVKIERYFEVEQKVIVNSEGGIAVESIPRLGVTYEQGSFPLSVKRLTGAVCTSESEVKKLVNLIKFLPDPAPERRISRADSFSKAFEELFLISELRYNTLEEAGITKPTNNIILLNDTGIHEVFGHHFEEPLWIEHPKADTLQLFGLTKAEINSLMKIRQSGTLMHRQKLANLSINLSDNPLLEIEGLKTYTYSQIDAYRRERNKHPLIENGKVVGFLGSDYGDEALLKNRFGINIRRKNHIFTGNAIQGIEEAFPQARMNCLVLDGENQEVDLEGVILSVPEKGSTSNIEKTYRIISFENYIIKDEEVNRIPAIYFEDEIRKAVRNINFLNNSSYGFAFCEKPNPVNTETADNITVSYFMKNQLWKKQKVFPIIKQTVDIDSAD